MSALQKVLGFWGDLEITYEKIGKGSSRKDVLLKLIGYNNGATTLDFLKSQIMKEYEGHEQECDALVKIFNAINNNLQVIVEVESIDDLNVFIADIVDKSSDVAAVVLGAVPDNFFSRLNPFENDTADEIGVLDMLTSFGILSDYFSIDNKGDTYSYIAVNSDDTIVIRQSTLPKFINKAQSGDPLYVKAYKALQYLVSEDYDLGKTMVFLGKDKFSSVPGKMFVEEGSKRIELSLDGHKKLDGVECYLAKHVNKLGEVLVVGVC